MTNEQTKAYIAGLLREREGAVRYGRDDNVREIDAELAKVGHKAQTPHQRSTRMQSQSGSSHAGAGKPAEDKDADAAKAAAAKKPHAAKPKGS